MSNSVFKMTVGLSDLIKHTYYSVKICAVCVRAVCHLPQGVTGHVSWRATLVKYHLEFSFRHTLKREFTWHWISGSRTKDQHRRNFVVCVEEVHNELCASKKLRKVILASAQTDMFAAEYRSDNFSGLHCRVIKNLKSNIKRSDCAWACRHLVQPTALITTVLYWAAPQLSHHRRRRNEIITIYTTFSLFIIR